MQNSTTGTEYTPTTEELRGVMFAIGPNSQAAFDRWLANYTCDVLYMAASRLNSYHPAWEQLHDMAEQAREKGVMREH